MKRILREFFFLRKGERRALVIIMILCCISLVVRIWLAKIPDACEEPDPEFLLAMIRLKEEVKRFKEDALQNELKTHSIVSKSEELAPFTFDPNTINSDSLRMLNLPGYIARNIISYRSAGGEFRTSEDLLKIYGMDEAVFKILEPFIIIRESPESNLPIEIPKKDFNILIDLNNSDSLSLLSIPGIGPSYSKRILKYRQMLGGYYMHEQLWEVYGMDSLRFLTLKKNTFIDTAAIRQIPLNSVTFSGIISHPYFNKAETYAIIHYRDYVDSLTNVKELVENQIIDRDRFMKVLPYLTLNLPKNSPKDVDLDL